MEGFRLSIEELVHELSDCIAFTKMSPERTPTIEKFAVFVEGATSLQADCLYLCLGNAMPQCKHVQPGTCIIALDSEQVTCEPSCTRCNLIALKDIAAEALINRISNLFAMYGKTCRQIEQCIPDDDRIPELLDIASKTLRLPMALMDEKLDVICTSGHKEMFPNPLWETIVRDRKIERCELLDNQNAKSYQMGTDEPDKRISGVPQANIHTFSDCESAFADIYLKGVPAATLWAFQTKPGKRFEPYKIHFLTWLASCLNDWAAETKMIQPSRGTKKERFLIDLLDGDFGHDDASAVNSGKTVGVEAVNGPEYQLMVFKPQQLLRPEIMLKITGAIEGVVPHSCGVLKETGIVVLLPIERSKYLSDRYVADIKEICRREKLYAILSTAYYHLTDTPSVFRQISSCFRYIDPENDPEDLYHYYNFMVRQSMHLVLDHQPPETMLHPMIRTLMAYDEQNHTDYLETFKIYLNNRCNITDAARQLHMHRNTMLHRAKRIEEILDSTFDDWNTRRMLLLSFDYLYLDEDKDI